MTARRSPHLLPTPAARVVQLLRHLVEIILRIRSRVPADVGVMPQKTVKRARSLREGGEHVGGLALAVAAEVKQLSSCNNSSSSSKPRCRHSKISPT
jgi:hypothetical protein